MDDRRSSESRLSIEMKGVERGINNNSSARDLEELSKETEWVEGLATEQSRLAGSGFTYFFTSKLIRFPYTLFTAEIWVLLCLDWRGDC